MKYCKNCNMKMDTTLHNCLFCNEELTKVSEDKEVYMFAPVHKKQKKSYLTRVFILLNFISALVSIFLDSRDNPILTWSLVVAISNLYVIIFILIVKIKTNWTATFSKAVILTLLALIFIGLAIRDYSWSLDYVLPLGLILNIVLLLVLLFFNRKKWFDFAINLFILSIFALIPGILQFFDQIIVIKWPSIASFFLGLSVLLGLFFVPSKASKEEFKRRFHV